MIAKRSVFNSIVAVAAILGAAGLGGCNRSNGPMAPAGSGVPVNLAMSFSGPSRGASLLKGLNLTSADSLRVDSIIVVVEKIKFLSPADSVVVDSMGDDGHGDGNGDGHGDGHHGGGDDGAEVTLQGPFVIHIADTIAVNFTSQLLPPGTYDGVTFVIHRLGEGERHEDSDEHHRGMVMDDSPVVGSSVVIRGAVKQNGAWVPFSFASDLELEFKISGNFVVQQAAGSEQFVLHFDLSRLFRDPETGLFLDPTDTSADNVLRIDRSLRLVFGLGHGGRDRNGDGHPDDE